MAIPLSINGSVFEYPENFDENWGINATGWAQAVTNGMLQRQGGNFPLTADANFGPNFGLLSKYFETRSANPATTGTVRLSSADAGIAWRNFANSGNNILTTDGSNNLQYNGSTISGGVNAGTQFKLAYYATTSNNVSPNPNTTAATQVLVTDANGVPTTTGNGGTTATEIGYVSGVTSAIQTQLNSKAPFQAIVQATTSTGSSTSSSTFQNSALAATITPTSSSHRIKVTATFSGSSDTNGNNAYFTVKRGSTNIGGTNGFVGINTTTGGQSLVPVCINYIDSPATTSATTYTVAFSSSNNTNTVEFAPFGNQIAVITLEEIV